MNAPPLLWLCFGLFLLWTGLRIFTAYRAQICAEPRLTLVFADAQSKAQGLDILKRAEVEVAIDPQTAEIWIPQKQSALATEKLGRAFMLEQTEYNLFVSARKITRIASESFAEPQNRF